MRSKYEKGEMELNYIASRFCRFIKCIMRSFTTGTELDVARRQVFHPITPTCTWHGDYILYQRYSLSLKRTTHITMATFAECYEKIKENYGISFVLKPEQSTIIELLASKNNVVAVLPTGYGKSLIYALLPLFLDQVTARLRTSFSTFVRILRA